MIKKTPKAKNCICILAVSLSRPLYDYVKELQDYYSQLKEPYDVHLFLDDEFNMPPPEGTLDINVHQIPALECFKHNYRYSILAQNTCKGKHVCVWDKAFYAFAHSDPYENYWFLEDDVFLPSIRALELIDKKLKSEKFDVLIKDNMIKRLKHRINKYPNDTGVTPSYLWDGLKKDPFYFCPTSLKWTHTPNEGFLAGVKRLANTSLKRLLTLKPLSNFPKDFCYNWPISNSLACAVRFSSKFLECVKKCVKNHKRLLFQEYIFGTLALHHNLKIYSGPLTGEYTHTKMNPRKLSTPSGWCLMPVLTMNDTDLKKYFETRTKEGSFAKCEILNHALKDLNDHLLFRQKIKSLIDRKVVKEKFDLKTGCIIYPPVINV